MAKKEEPELTREQKFSAARNTALRHLREKYRKEWNALLKLELAKAGITDWTPPLTEEERAQQTIIGLLEQFPSLRRSWLPSPGTPLAGESPGRTGWPNVQQTNSPELPPDPDSLPVSEPPASAPPDPVLTKKGEPDPAEDVTRNDYA